MPGASLSLFSRAQERGFDRVLHAVNAHPEFHNAVLSDTYGAHRVREELIPAWMAARQNEELGRASTVLVPSNAVCEQMINAGVPREKIVILPYGVDLSFFDTEPVHKHPPANKRPRLLFVGQVSYRKGVPILLQAIRKADVDLTIAGPIVSKAVLDDLPPNASYVGVHPRERIRELMLTHDAFVLPSIEDACALATLEAASTGLPVITTTANGAHNLLTNRDQVAVAPGDVGQLISAVSAVEPLTQHARDLRRAHVRSPDSQAVNWDAYGNSILRNLLPRPSHPQR